MRFSRCVRLTFVVATCVLLWAAALWLLPLSHTARASPGLLFAKTMGTGTACTQAQPCSLATALGKAVAGDVLYVAAGTYTGSGNAVVSITRGITLYGGWDGAAAGPVVLHPDNVSILDGQHVRRGVFITGTFACTVAGFTVVNGNGTSGPDPGRGGGIYSYGAWPLIDSNVISGNIACNAPPGDLWPTGGGISVWNAGGPVVIRDNWVWNNIAAASGAASGGGIFLYGSPGAQILWNYVGKNTATLADGGGYGGGIAVQLCDRTTVSGNNIESNFGGPGGRYGGSRGGGIDIEESAGLVLSENQIRYNIAGYGSSGQGGGVYAGWADGWVCSNNLIEGNWAAEASGQEGSGGGVLVYNSRRVNLSGNRLLSNTSNATAGYGGGIEIEYGVGFTMTNNIVAGNVSSQSAGGLSMLGSSGMPVTATLRHNTFADNDGGSVKGRAAIDLSGAVSLALVNSLFSGHTYAVYAWPDARATLNRNLFFASSDADTGGSGSIVNTAAITGQDPLLNGQYHLRPGSPAINAAVNAGITTDIDGDARPAGAGYDIGADEYTEPRRVFLPLLLRRP